MWNIKEATSPAGAMPDGVAADWSVDGNDILCATADGNLVLTGGDLNKKRTFSGIFGDEDIAADTLVTSITGVQGK